MTHVARLSVWRGQAAARLLAPAALVAAACAVTATTGCGPELRTSAHSALTPAGGTAQRTDAAYDPKLPWTAPGLSMQARLQTIATTIDPNSDPYLNAQRAEIIRAAWEQSTDLQDKIVLAPRLPLELLNAGKCDEAVRAYDAVEQFYRKNAPQILRDPNNLRHLYLHEAIAYLRLGEQQNCCARHNADSCLAPIQAGGVHTAQRGARGAVAVLTRLLALSPNDMSAQWLLNLAHMTLGDYPAGVPARWRIPPAVFRSEYPMRRFRDVAPDLGLDIEDVSGSVAVEDFEGTGNLDILVSSFDPHRSLRYYRNNGDGTFTERTQTAGLSGELGGLNVIVGDYNNDGFPDVLVLRGAWLGEQGRQPLSLVRNNGNGTFTDVTEQAGLLRYHPTQTAVFFDYNNDGWLDIFVGNETTTPEHPHPCELFRNNRDGTFTEVAAQCSCAITGFVKAVVTADYNNDGRPDLYLSCRGEPGILLRNDGPATPGGDAMGPWKFTDVTEQAGVGGPKQKFAAFWFDYDNDGWPDLFVSGYEIMDIGDVANDYLGRATRATRCRLYHNDHNGHFTDVSHAVGLDRVMPTMAANFGDLDNDGWLDFYLGTGNPDLSSLMPKRLFRNAAGRRFQDVTTAADVGNLQKGHGIAFADFTNTGQQDILEKVGGAYEGDLARMVLFKNPGSSGHWIGLKLIGVQTNRSAIGARIKVTVPDNHGTRAICRTVGTGGNFGCNPLRQEIGLGAATKIESVDIAWPVSGQTQRLTGLPVDRFYTVREGDAAARPWPLRALRFAPASRARLTLQAE